MVHHIMTIEAATKAAKEQFEREHYHHIGQSYNDWLAHQHSMGHYWGAKMDEAEND